MTERVAGPLEVRDCEWRVAELMKPGARDGFRADWLKSIRRFNEDLQHNVVQAAAIAAKERQPDDLGACFRYFCGICWAKIRDQDAAAPEILRQQ